MESVDLVELTYRTVNLLYNTKDTVHLIDPENGEEFEVEMTSFMGGEKALGFYDESTPLTIIQSDAEEVVRAQGPQIVVVEVKEVDESKGSMGSEHRQTTRNATLVSGAQVLVPSFIKPGDKVKCSVEDRRFISRA